VLRTAGTCPYGSDPHLANQALAEGKRFGVENQTLVCGATAGAFTLTFRGHTTTAIAYSATAAELKTAFEALPTVGVVVVTPFTAGGLACGAGDATTTVAFATELGPLPLITVGAAALTGGSATFYRENAATVNNLECSGRGTCGECSA
jgi:hypothetical protein